VATSVSKQLEGQVPDEAAARGIAAARAALANAQRALVGKAAKPAPTSKHVAARVQPKGPAPGHATLRSCARPPLTAGRDPLGLAGLVVCAAHGQYKSESAGEWLTTLATARTRPLPGPRSLRGLVDETDAMAEAVLANFEAGLRWPVGDNTSHRP
jgi:hypothetical protein